ncbi:DUF1800 domain-containing protein [Candidatus Planktophila dulcis]|uniref:DUF1800 domain-containing protein n=1 Tax=Candidatus Planktophila dulcis TaxID=1884914 RepID=UPI000BAC8975|nr:DUF1800 domain-containing protein [Candidatus Planktophila dulcis]ASY20680.1 DUF1800 domain-containing protein [Candidatus Planktophila dulcis]
MNAKRLEIARLSHRFAFGPRPGEFAAALAAGVSATRQKVLTVPATDAGAALVANPVITDLGVRPKPNTPEIIPFVTGMRNQTEQLTIWWLDRMAMSDHGLSERMAWFWHGHWATSITKVDHPLAMYKQNQILRQYALGNFAAMSRAMVNDAALQYWLDGQTSTAKAPNENLARELMELFILGVNRYTEDDVKALARVLTGYQLSLNAATVLVNPKRRDMGAVTLLGQSSTFTAESASDYLVAKADCATFIAERLWYRFISSTEEMPKNLSAVGAFASREVAPAVASLAQDGAMSDPKYSMVKSPVEWFISACRALELTPSKLIDSKQLINHLNKLGQIPFYPPNVGGWPAAEAWLSSASAQYRIAFASWLIKQSPLRAFNEIPVDRRVLASADWLGVAQWSPRTQAALRNALGDPQEFTLLALCSPEYVVSA